YEQIDRIADAVGIPVAAHSGHIPDIRKTKQKVFYALQNTFPVLGMFEAMMQTLKDHDDESFARLNVPMPKKYKLENFSNVEQYRKLGQAYIAARDKVCSYDL